MIRSSTPTHEFAIPLPADMIADIWVTYTQFEKIVLVKRKADMKNDGGIWSVRLRQEETNLFEGDALAFLEVKALTTDGEVMVGEKVLLTVEDVQNDEVMG